MTSKCDVTLTSPVTALSPGVFNVGPKRPFQNRDETRKNDILHYLAIGNVRVKEYPIALKYIQGLLQVEPCNWRAQLLENKIKGEMEEKGSVGMGILHRAAEVVRGLVSFGILLSKPKTYLRFHSDPRLVMDIMDIDRLALLQAEHLRQDQNDRALFREVQICRQFTPT